VRNEYIGVTLRQRFTEVMKIIDLSVLQIMQNPRDFVTDYLSKLQSTASKSAKIDDSVLLAISIILSC
jgi:hypothetical protein